MIARRVRGMVIALALLAPARPAATSDQWLEATSPHFTVVSNNGERSARDVAWQLEQVRTALQQLWPWSRVQLDRPLLVIGAKDENTMKLLAPAYWESGSRSHPVSVSAYAADRYYIALRADLTVNGPEGVNPYRQSYWTYADLTLSSSFKFRLPLWFTRGLSAVLSNTNVTDKEVQFGRSDRGYVQELTSGGRFALADLLNMNNASFDTLREIEQQRYDAQVWALMHYMLFGTADAPTRESRVNELVRVVLGGTPQVAGVEQVYGPLPALDATYRQYVERGMFRYVTVKADLRVVAKEFTVRPLTDADTLAIRAGYYVATSRPADARKAIEAARLAAPQLAAPYDAEAMLLEQEGKLEEARVAYGKAVDLGSQSFYSYLRLANLTPHPHPTPETLSRLRAWLTRAVELNDADPWSHQSLCNVLLELNLPADALTAARKAVSLDPGQAYLRLSLATALQRLSQHDEALQEARTALSLARNDAERRDAQALMDWLAKIKGAPAWSRGVRTQLPPDIFFQFATYSSTLSVVTTSTPESMMG